MHIKIRNTEYFICAQSRASRELFVNSETSCATLRNHFAMCHPFECNFFFLFSLIISQDIAIYYFSYKMQTQKKFVLKCKSQEEFRNAAPNVTYEQPKLKFQRHKVNRCPFCRKIFVHISLI